MAEINYVLLTVPYKGTHRERLEDALAGAELMWVDRYDAEGIEQALKTADVAILSSDLDRRFLSAPKLCWVHCDHAGLEKSAMPELFEANMMVTSSAGRSAPALAEHAIFFMLALAYEYPRFLDAQRAHKWGIANQDGLRGLYGRTVGIVGVGNNGKEVATRAKALGMRVLAYDVRQPDEETAVDEMYTEHPHGLEAVLCKSDFVVVTLPLNDSTYHLIGERELVVMPKGSFLVNIGRGAVVDEEALLSALNDGYLAGAGLDTFAVEPLPVDSPLWDAPGVLITPHVTPQVPDRTGRSLDIICENIERYRREQPLNNLLAASDVFSCR